MQFLEKGLSGLETAVHKVDALAAKVAVERGVARESEPDELAADPSAFDTADAIRALATRLGEWTAPSGADGGRESEAHLDATLTELEAAEAAWKAAVARRDEAETRLADEIGVRDREESDATDEARGLERELERERAAHAMTKTQAETRARHIADDSVEYDAMLEAAERATGERIAEADAADAEAKAAREVELGLTREAETAETAAETAEAEAARAEAAEEDARRDGSSSRSANEEEKTAREVDELRAAVAAAEEEAASLAARERRAREAARKARAPASSSSVERERDHARRMADVEAQLTRKRSQVSALETEKAELEAKLATALRRAGGGGGGRGGGGAGSSFGGAGGSRGGLKRRGAGVDAAGEFNVPGWNPADTPGRIGFRRRVRVVAGRVDALSAEAGRHLRRSGGWRSAMIVYVLSLHSLAFLILAVRALTAAPGK